MGWSQYHDIGNNQINNAGPTHESQLGAGAFGGYQVNPYVGFEMGYDWLGRMPYKGTPTRQSKRRFQSSGRSADR